MLGKPAMADMSLGLATAPILYAAEGAPEIKKIVKRRFKKEVRKREGEWERDREGEWEGGRYNWRHKPRVYKYRHEGKKRYHRKTQGGREG